MSIKGAFVLGAAAIIAAAVPVLILSETTPAQRRGWTRSFVCTASEALSLDPCDLPRNGVAAPSAPSVLVPPSAAVLAQARSGAAAAPVERPPMPWDDPNWDEKVARKILAKLLEPADQPTRTGSLSPPEPVPIPAEPVLAPSPPEPAQIPVSSEPPLKPAAAASPRLLHADLPPALAPDGPAIPADENAGKTVAAADPTGPVAEPQAARAPPAEPVSTKEAEPARTKEPEPTRTKEAEPTQPAAAPTADRRKASAEVAASYLETLSLPNEQSLAGLRRLSADRVQYYDKPISGRAWNDIKRRFADRWPVRSYRQRPGSFSVTCEAARCLVRSTIDWTTSNAHRGESDRGTSKLELGIDFSGARPMVYREALLRIRQAGGQPQRITPNAGPARAQTAARPDDEGAETPEDGAAP
jgi:hypothetical protein